MTELLILTEQSQLP